MFSHKDLPVYFAIKPTSCGLKFLGNRPVSEFNRKLGQFIRGRPGVIIDISVVESCSFRHYLPAILLLLENIIFVKSI
jgi:hypothetical protein